MTGNAVYGTPWLMFDVISSTNDVARAWALAGAPAGALVTASSQAKGRGRRGAKWIDTPGQSAIMTFVGSRQRSLEAVWRLPFAASLAVQRAARQLGAEAVQVKWPNDVVCEGRKLAGILVETAAVGAGEAAPIIGIGVNVAQRSFAEPEAYANPPTSLSLETRGAARSPLDVIEAVGEQLSALVPLLGTWDGWERLIDEWQGVMVRGVAQGGVTSEGEAAEGVLLSVRASDGAALVQKRDGATEAIWPSLVAA